MAPNHGVSASACAVGEPSPLDRRTFLRFGGEVAAAAAIGLGAVACSSSVGTSAASSSSSSGSIRVRFWGTGAERAAWFNRIDYFKKQFPHIKVTPELLTQNGYQAFPALLTEIASGNAPDVLRVLNYQPTQLVAQGNALLALDSFVAKDTKLDPSDFAAAPWAAAHVGGKLYALPENGEPYVVYYNKTAFDKAGIPTPTQLLAKGKWNQETLLSSASAVMAKGGVKYGVAFESWNYDNIAFMGGGRILSAELQPVINQSPTPETYQYFADLINVHKVAPTSEVSAGTYLTNFGNGQLGMYISGAWWGIDYIAPLAGSKFEWAEVIMPEINGHVGCKLELDALSISADTKNAQAAWDFISTVTNSAGERIWTAAATPSRTSVLDSAAYRRLSYSATVQEMVKHATFTPFTKAGAAIDTAVTTALSPMWLGRQSATEATKNAASALVKALSNA